MQNISINASFIKVSCYYEQWLLGIPIHAFTDYLSLGFRDPKIVSEKRRLKSRSLSKKNGKENGRKRFDVHVIGIDSVSRLNSVRLLPKVRNMGVRGTFS